jgi:putative hydrolase of the HAD superfamily
MVKNLIFDVGDVLLEYRWLDMMMDYGMTREKALKLGSEVFDNPYWTILDLGTLSQEQVIEGYRMIYPEHAEMIAWFITHGELMYVKRPQVWERVHQLKKAGYSIYILSNYSEELFRKHTKEATFLKDLDGGVISYQVHMTKPDRRIYQYLLDRYQLKAEECIFFDDKKENTQAAKELGICAETITSQEQLLNLLDERLGNYDRSNRNRAGL